MSDSLTSGEELPGSTAAEASGEDADFALAKLMQEQERAFYRASSQHFRNRNGEAEAAGDSNSNREDEEGDHSDGETDSERDDGANEGLEGEDAEGLDDEELARRLFMQEQVDHQRHLMLMAGLDPDASTEDDDDEGEEQYLTEDSLEPDDMTYEELRALGDAVGVVSRGALPSLIQALPLARYVAPGAEAGGSMPGGAGADVTCRQEEQCVICRMEFEGGEDVKLLPCKHIFHPACLDQWLVINKACPICSKELCTEEVEQQEKSSQGVQTAQVDKCS